MDGANQRRLSIVQIVRMLPSNIHYPLSIRMPEDGYCCLVKKVVYFQKHGFMLQLFYKVVTSLDWQFFQLCIILDPRQVTKLCPKSQLLVFLPGSEMFPNGSRKHVVPFGGPTSFQDHSLSLTVIQLAYVPWSKVAILGMGDLPPLMTESL